MPPVLAGVLGVVLVAGVLWDAFETVVLPRRVMRPLRLTRLFYRATWRPWSALARRMTSGAHREGFLAFYGPLSIIFLLAMWVAALVCGFGLLYEASDAAPPLTTHLYMSGTTFFTLGLGDVTPANAAGRILAVAEAGIGFGFLGIVIGYLPVIYQAFSRRERQITLLGARAGSPPTASGVIARLGTTGDDALSLFFDEWEEWAADILETHLSYPVLGYFRSQHDDESWLAALTVVLDAAAATLALCRAQASPEAARAFAMGRHAAIDLAQIFAVSSDGPCDRLAPADRAELKSCLRAAGIDLLDDGAADAAFERLRRLYEPQLAALADYLLMPLPPWIEEHDADEEEPWMISPHDISTEPVPEER